MTVPVAPPADVPFTGSHPAAVLPLLRTPLPASTLVVGSIAPDVPVHLPVELPWATHTALPTDLPARGIRGTGAGR